MGRLTLALLGNPQLYHEDRPVELPTRKALALLVYLAVEGGTHSREKLAAIFWPERGNSSGRANLRNTLAQLRKPLRQSQETPHLVVERDALAFDFESDFTSDWHRLQMAASARQRAPLQQVVEQCRGDFLDGFSLGDAPDFDDWASLRREQAHRQLETMFDRLSRMQMEAGETAVALTTTNRWLQHNPLNEAAYRRLMRLYLIGGDKAAAQAAYDQCRSLLARELDAGPAPETKALAQRIHLARAESRRQNDERSASLSSLPLVGRAAEHSQLVAAFHRSEAAKLQVVVIEGEAGVGKTRLGAEFLNWAAAQGADVLRGRAFETGGRLPYQPWVQALRLRLEAENAPEDLLDDVWLAELSHLLPELRHRYPDLPPPGGDESLARPRFFESVSRLGEALATAAPLILFLDDVQWADAATRDLLHYTADRWSQAGTPLLLLLTLRAEALATPHLGAEGEVAQWLDDLEQAVPLQRLRLAPLTAAQTAELVQSLAGENLEAAVFAEWLHQETGGQPFYLHETLKALLEQDWLRPAEDGAGSRLDVTLTLENDRIHPDLRGFLPPGVHKVVRQRLARLSQHAFSLAVAGAVLGQEFDFAQLCRLAGVRQRAALAALDELLSARLLLETEQEKRPYTFAHDKIRDVVYTEAGDARRRLYHRQALALLAEEQAPAAQLAHQALRAGLSETAVHHSVSAGDEAMALFTVRDAVAHYEQARQILAEQPNVQLDDARRLHLYTRLGRAYDILGELDRAEAVYWQMAALAQENDDPAAQAQVLNRLADIKAYQHDVEAALRLLDEALPLAQRSHDKRALAETHWNVAHLGLHGGGVEQMEEHGRKALQLAREVDEAELIVRCLNALAYNARNQGQVAEGLAYGREALQRNRDLGNRALEADCLGVLSQMELLAGRPETAVAHAREALDISREIESAHGIGFNSITLGLALLECGRLNRAAAVMEPLTTVMGGEQGAHEQVMAQIVLGVMHRAQGALEAAMAGDEAAWRTLRRHEGELAFPLQEIVAVGLTEDHALLSDWEAAATYARQTPLPVPGIWLFLVGHFRWWLVVEALWRDGEQERAEALAQRLGKLAESCPRFRLAHRRSLAALARWDGQIEEAMGHLKTAVSLAEEMGLPRERDRARAALATLKAAQEHT